MKTLAIIAVAGALASPALCFAQSSNEPVIRAQVRGDLVQLEQAGYNPAMSDNAHYPTNIQAAEARVSAQDDAQLANTSMGGVPSGSSASGGPDVQGGASAGTRYGTYPAYPATTGPAGTYGATSCQGPESFCNIYRGGR
ncbi:MAG TPA: DUF4148 domain-containing protein [Paraburkholderia sp.]